MRATGRREDPRLGLSHAAVQSVGGQTVDGKGQRARTIVCLCPAATTIAVVSLIITQWPHLHIAGTPSRPTTYTTYGASPDRRDMCGSEPDGQLAGASALSTRAPHRGRAAYQTIGDIPDHYDSTLPGK